MCISFTLSFNQHKISSIINIIIHQVVIYNILFIAIGTFNGVFCKVSREREAYANILFSYK